MSDFALLVSALFFNGLVIAAALVTGAMYAVGNPVALAAMGTVCVGSVVLSTMTLRTYQNARISEVLLVRIQTSLM